MKRRSPVCRLLVAVLLLTCNTISTTRAATCTSNTDAEGEQSCGRIPSVTLANGVEMPQLSLGAAHLMTQKGHIESNLDFVGFVPEDTYRSVQLGLEAGMRGIEMALIYRSHRAIGHVLGNWFAAGKLKRKDVFLATKVFHGPCPPVATAGTYLGEIDDMTPEDVTEMTTLQFEQSLHEVGVGYFDLVMMHWPASMDSKASAEENGARRIAAWKVLEKFYKMGWARAIGVSNFNEHHLEQLMKDGAEIRPMVNQIEGSVYLQFDNIVEYCQANNIVVQAYSPLGRQLTNVLHDPVVLQLAQKHNKNAGQIALRYLVQKGYALTCLSSSEERLRSNQDIFFFELDDDDMDKLSELNRPDGSWGLASPYDLA
jgi:diketogulonate reductase-like aldo/keto reductase